MEAVADASGNRTLLRCIHWHVRVATCVPEGLGCSATGVFDSPDDAVPVAVRRARRMRTSVNGGSLGGRVGYFPAGQSCLEAAINEAQSSGGLPRASILANTL